MFLSMGSKTSCRVTKMDELCKLLIELCSIELIEINLVDHLLLYGDYIHVYHTEYHLSLYGIW